MAVPANEQIVCSVALGLGGDPGAEQIAFSFAASSIDVGRMARIPYELAAGATDQSFDLASLAFDSTVFIAIVDHSSIGVKYGKSAGAVNHLTCAAGKFAILSDTTPPTLYLDNLSADEKSFGEIIVFGSST